MLFFQKKAIQNKDYCQNIKIKRSRSERIKESKSNLKP